MTTENGTTKPIFRDIDPDEADLEATVIESLCFNCHEKGTTRLLLTKIPFFKELIISSFSCPHCGFAGSEFQSAGMIDERGVKITLEVYPGKDLDRQVVKTEATTITFPELDFEIPPESQKGTLTTIEGILQRAIDGLLQEQPVRKALDQVTADKIDDFVEKLKSLKNHERFTMVVDDPSGNCFVENPVAPNPDPQMSIVRYRRTPEQNEFLGLGEGSETETTAPIEDQRSLDIPEEVFQFKTNCSVCHTPINTNMKMVQIPYFKKVIIMAVACDACGYRSNEVRSGSGFSDKGKCISLRVTNLLDMSRDVLKSETCAVKIPELELEFGGYAIAGKFTTLEGLLTDIKDVLARNPFTLGDSIKSITKNKIKEFGEKIEKLKEGEAPFTIILDDPVGNSYLQNINAPEPDPALTIVEYERTFEQNEDLGLNQMKTENYAE